MLRPGGSAGAIVYEVIVPNDAGMSGVSAWATQVWIALCGYINPVGGGRGVTTAICTIAVAAPAELEAVIVKDDFADAADGVPVMSPVVPFKLSPAGRAGLTV
jgi:hypothetical protein